MKLGIVLPSELEDPIAVRDLAQALDDMGYDQLVFPDHPIGGNPATHKINGPYTYKSFFHELFVTMGFVAGVTKRIELVAGVLILPQRQTALAAKQAAAVDVLSSGRCRIGIGGGWNQLEFDTLGMNFAERGARLDEQVEVMRALWREPLVTYEGKWDKIRDVGINPLPVRQDIPVWFGGWSDPMVRRLARTGDGWMLYTPNVEIGREALGRLDAECARIGRNRGEIGIEGWIMLNRSDVMRGMRQRPNAAEIRSHEEWAKDISDWKAAGATHLDCWTMYGNLHKADEHIELARQFKEVADSV